MTAPRVDDRRAGERFASELLPPYARRSPKVSEVLPILYLRGLSTGDFAPALADFFGADAGLSASSIRAAGLAMAYKLVRVAEERWRRVNAPHLVPLVRAGAIFIDGQLQERKEAATDDIVTGEDAAA